MRYYSEFPSPYGVTVIKSFRRKKEGFKLRV